MDDDEKPTLTDDNGSLYLHEDEKPVLTEQQLWRYLRFDEGLPVTRRAIKYAVLRREIQPYRIGGGNFFSKRDGLAWIKSRRQSGIYRAPESRAAGGE